MGRVGNGKQRKGEGQGHHLAVSSRTAGGGDSDTGCRNSPHLHDPMIHAHFLRALLEGWREGTSEAETQ